MNGETPPMPESLDEKEMLAVAAQLEKDLLGSWGITFKETSSRLVRVEMGQHGPTAFLGDYEIPHEQVQKRVELIKSLSALGIDPARVGPGKKLNIPASSIGE